MPAHIAVVDDDRDIREMLSTILTSAGFRVSLVPNGLKLIAVLRASRPDIILLDVMMSWIDGFELCRSLKRNPDFAQIPIVFLSGRTTQADISHGMSCGAIDYLTKPVRPDELIQRIRRVVASTMASPQGLSR
jgi:DNA-binding response OmpR family regulator